MSKGERELVTEWDEGEEVRPQQQCPCLLYACMCVHHVIRGSSDDLCKREGAQSGTLWTFLC
jgi:hypothetical protein